MPYTKEQWRAIAARVMQSKGRAAGERYLHNLKAEAGRRSKGKKK